ARVSVDDHPETTRGVGAELPARGERVEGPVKRGFGKAGGGQEARGGGGSAVRQGGEDLPLGAGRAGSGAEERLEGVTGEQREDLGAVGVDAGEEVGGDGRTGADAQMVAFGDDGDAAVRELEQEVGE